METGNQVVVLMLGGNMGNTLAFFKQTLKLIEVHIGEVTTKSQIYKSAPWGFAEQAGFLNQAMVMKTSLSPELLLKKTMFIEKKLGKSTKILNGPRVIDIDIMFYNGEIIENAKLTIPHPRLHLRRFNLVPLAEIIPDFIHPAQKKSIKTLLQNCTDPLHVSAHMNLNQPD